MYMVAVGMQGIYHPRTLYLRTTAACLDAVVQSRAPGQAPTTGIQENDMNNDRHYEFDDHDRIALCLLNCYLTRARPAMQWCSAIPPYNGTGRNERYPMFQIKNESVDTRAQLW